MSQISTTQSEMKAIPEIILVDDDEEDRRLLTEAFNDINSSLTITEFFYGEDALACLEEKKISGHFPVLIVLDLFLPKLSGLQILSRIKADTALSVIPVVLYDTFCSQQDQLLIHQYGAKWIEKPSNQKALLQAATTMIRYIHS